MQDHASKQTKMMLTHYYINESWKTIEMKEDTKGHMLHDFFFFNEMSRRDRKIDDWLGRSENGVQRLLGFLMEW